MSYALSKRTSVYTDLANATNNNKGGETRVFDAAGPNGQRFTLTQSWSLPPALYARWIVLREQNNPATGAAYTAGEALGALNCGQLCTPQSYTTYPFTTDRTRRSASEQPVALQVPGS